MQTNFHCSDCDQYFQRNANLINHRKVVHAIEVKKFLCPQYPVCKTARSDGFYFPFTNLVNHYEKHHINAEGEVMELNKNEVKCAIVNKKSKYKHNLKNVMPY